MSATPIPRTLALMVYGDLDISVLDELPPAGKRSKPTSLTRQKRARAFGYVQRHLDAGRQGYLICPLIEEDESGMMSVTQYGELVKKGPSPPPPWGCFHGKMKPAEKEQVMEDFSQGKTQLLVSTTVVEVGGGRAQRRDHGHRKTLSGTGFPAAPAAQRGRIGRGKVPVHLHPHHRRPKRGHPQAAEAVPGHGGRVLKSPRQT